MKEFIAAQTVRLLTAIPLIMVILAALIKAEPAQEDSSQLVSEVSSWNVTESAGYDSAL